MKKLFPVLMCAVLIAGLSGVAFADLTQSATTRVAVNVVSTVGVTVQAPAIPSYQIGDPYPEISVVFNIHSNSEMLQFTAAATDLHKGDVLASPFKLIPVGGVHFACEFANPINGASAQQPYAATCMVNGNWPALQTNPIVFDSGTNNTFSQLCTLKFKWSSDDLELPVGQYSGFVKLVATVYPIQIN